MKLTDNLKRKIEKRRRKLSIAALMLRGVYDVPQIASAVGIGPMPVRSLMREVFDEWVRHDARFMHEQIALASRQYSFCAAEAINGWERSKQNEEQITTEYIAKECSSCKGSGFFPVGSNEWCPICDGNGMTTVEQVTRRVKGQAGDPALLANFRECIKERAKLLDLYPQRSYAKWVKEGGGPALGDRARQIDWSKVSKETVMDVRRAILRLTVESANGNGNGKVIDV